MKIKQSLTLLFISIFLYGCVTTEEPSIGSLNGNSNPNAEQRWASTAPFPLKLEISDNFSANEQAAIESMATQWSDSVNNSLTFFNTEIKSGLDEKASMNSYSDSKLGVYLINNWYAELPSSALAVTQIFGYRRNVGTSAEYIEITHADILVNYDYFAASFTLDSGDNGKYDLPTVMLHELGHFLGLQHQSSASVMLSTIGQSSVFRDPTIKDIGNIKATYLGGAAVSAARASTRSLTRNENNNNDHPVQIIFEMMTDGTEVKRVISGNTETREVIHLNHKH